MNQLHGLRAWLEFHQWLGKGNVAQPDVQKQDVLDWIKRKNSRRGGNQAILNKIKSWVDFPNSMVPDVEIGYLNYKIKLELADLVFPEAKDLELRYKYIIGTAILEKGITQLRVEGMYRWGEWQLSPYDEGFTIDDFTDEEIVINSKITLDLLVEEKYLVEENGNYKVDISL